MEIKIAAIITVIGIILSLTVGLILSPIVAEYNKQHNIEWGSSIQTIQKGLIK